MVGIRETIVIIVRIQEKIDIVYWQRVVERKLAESEICQRQLKLLKHLKFILLCYFRYTV